jgi:hypothetical protein
VGGNGFRFRGSVIEENLLVLLVSAIQRVIGPFDEHDGPLDETGGQKTCDHAEDYFLEKGRVH